MKMQTASQRRGKARPYESPLRAEQADRTREKLLDTAIDIAAEGGGDDLTVRLVAARAGVSVPTAYRHFPDRDALLDALATKIRTRLAGAILPTMLDELPAWVRRVYGSYERDDRLVRTQLNTAAGRTMRANNQRARNPKLVEMVQRSLPAAPPDTHRRLTALLNLLVHAPAWVALHDQWGMSGAEAGAAATWAIETLLTEIRRNPSALAFLPGDD